MTYDDEPDRGYRLQYGPGGTLLAWCAIVLLLFAIGVTVIQ